MIIPVWSALVGPHLQHGAHSWYAPFKKGIDTLERAQRRATKMIKELENLLCGERLKELGLFTLEKRRLKGISS